MARCPAVALVACLQLGCTDPGGADPGASVDGGPEGSVPDPVSDARANETGADAAGDGPADIHSSPDSGSGDGADAARMEAAIYVYVGGYSPPITTFAFNLGTGALRQTSTVGAGISPSYLAFAPDKRHLYAINEEADPSRLLAFSIDPASGALAEINAVSAEGSVAAHLSVHPSGKWVAAANFGTGNVVVAPIGADGSLSAPIDDKMAGLSAHMALFDAAGSFLFVPCRDSDHVATYRFQSGTLVPSDPPTVPVGGGPRHIAFDPAERFAYVLGETASTITSFRYDPATGRMTDPDIVTTTDPGAEGASAHVLVHPSGKFLYASNRLDNSIAFFTVDPTSGRLTKQGYARDMISGPRNFTVDPSGAYLIAANQGTANLIVFKIDEASGKLTRAGDPVPVADGPAFVGVLTLP